MDNSEDKDNNELNTLEGQGTVTGDDANQASTTNNNKKPVKKKRKFSPLAIVSHINIYFLFFLLIVVVAGLIVFIGYQRDQDSSKKQEQLDTQSLSAEELAQLAGSDTRIGDPQQLLTVESNAVFTGQVLVRDSLDVAGTLRVGGDLSLPGITVSGMSSFDEIQANSLSIAGNTNIQEQLTVDGSLTVSGGGSFSGGISAPSITTDSLQLGGDLQITRHIDAGGPSPSASTGGAIGSGGTVSINGSDTAGTVNINPGSGAGNGAVATVNFANGFNSTPHVVVTPIGRHVNYYITKNTSGFTIFIVGSLSSGNMSFDYIAYD